MNGVEESVYSEAEGRGGNEDDLPIKAMPPGPRRCCSVP